MTNAISAATPQTNQQTSRASLAQNFDTFLTLLTAQLQNQDPLDPVDSSKFTDQLVQFSQVEQQIETNQQMKQLLANQNAAATGAAIGYIGRTAQVKGAVTPLTDAGAQWNYELPQVAARVNLSVVDGVGRTVFEAQQVGQTGKQAFTWDGRDLNGQPRPPGNYRLKVEALDASGEKIAATISVRERITGVDIAAGEPTFMTNSGQRSFGDILRVLE
jgi:flagellar basal-body rod modification protein FlgD